MIRFTLLGLVRVAVGDREVPLPPKERTVLAALLLRAGEVVSVAALAEAIWDDAPPPSARNTIQGHIKQLRRLLGPASARIITRAPGYLIEVRPGELDSRTVTELRAQASARAHAGEWDRAARLLRDALALWTGDPLADVRSAFLQRTEASRLAELRLDTLEECAEADLRRGRNEACAADLRALAAGHPFRERLWELLMLALYRADRQGDALSAYQQARQALRDGLGADPGRRLQDLHARILAADPALSQDPAPAAGQGPPAGAHGGALAAHRETPRQLPGMLPDFTGRRDEVGRLLDSLTRPGCAAVIAGPGGVGKTALAVHVAHQMAARFPDGQMFIRLGGAASPVPPASLLGRLLRDLGVPDSGIPADEDERAARYRTLLADRTALIVLDDASSAAQVRPLLPGAGGSAVIVTSRVTLADLSGAAFTELAVLGAGESRAMLASIAGERRTASDPEGTDGVLSSCAGLPLAIRIAGSRLATSPGWTVGQLSGLLRRERQRLGELAVGDTAVRATFEVSYLSLPAGTPESARVFRLFGLAGLPTLSLAALAALAGAPVTMTAAAAATLVDAHLLESPGPGRFQAHDLLRIYAAERAGADETDRSRRDALRRLLAWYQHALNACVQEFRTVKQPVPLEPLDPSVPAPGITGLADALQWLQAEQANLVPAVMLAASQGLTDSCWRLAWLMRYYFDWYGRWSESAAVLEAGLSAAETSGNKAATAALSNGMGAVLWKLGQLEAATNRYGRALAIRRELGDKKGASTVLSNLGLAEIASGRVASAIGRFTEALAVNRDLEYRSGEAHCLHNLGYAYEATGRPQEALAAYQEGLAIRVRHCSLNDQAASLHSIGALLITMDRVDDAMDYLHRSLKICQDNNVGYGEGLTLASLGDGYLALGKPADAHAAWQQAHDILTEIGATEASAVRERLANLTLPAQAQSGTQPGTGRGRRENARSAQPRTSTRNASVPSDPKSSSASRTARRWSGGGGWGTRVSRGGLPVTRDASFKKAVRRHSQETGQRYTKALTDLEGLGARMHHEPAAERLLAPLRDRYGIDPVAATKLSVHKTYVFRIDRNDGSPWVARAFPPARPRAGAEGDAAILRFLERQDYPAERLAVDDAVSDFDGSAVLVTRFVEGAWLPDGAEKFAMMGELLGRLHALPYDDSADRPGGASGEDPDREGTPRQDLLAALSFLNAVDTKVTAAERERFERLRDKVRSADDGHGLPEGLLHGNLLHAPDHAVLSGQGSVAINWKASGRGPRLADLAYLIWGTGSWNPRRPNQEHIDAAVNAYRRHIEPTDDELGRLEAVMYIRTLYLACFGYRRAVTDGARFCEWGFIHPPEYFSSTAAATRAAFRR